MPAGEKVFPPGYVVLSGQEQPVHRLHLLVKPFRLPAVGVHHALRLAGVEHPPIGAEPIPPDPGGWQAAAAYDTHQADFRMGKQVKQVCH